ncbi:MAG: hypothetical protein JXN65_12265 [Clostridia bacterium]|nr:hypothetical protein [Clostridia bacterium]
MNRQVSKTIITIFSAAVLLVSAALLILLPEKTISENENRYLAKFTKITAENFFSGEAMEDIEIYINDHFPFRDIIVGIKSDIDKIIGKKELNGVYLGRDDYLIQSFDGYDDETMQKHAEIIDAFSDNLDFSVYFMLAPTSSGIYSDKKPRYNDDKNQIEYIKKMYDKIQNAVKIDTFTPLLEEKDNKELYFRLDHHWNAHGAYIAYLAFCEAAGLRPFAEDDFSIETVADDFCGTYYSKSTYYRYKKDTIDVYVPKFEYDYSVEYVKESITTNTLYEDSHLSTKDKYAYFLDGNHSLIKIENNLIDDGSSIAVVKDSYANILIPFIVNHYSTVYVIDMRLFTQPLSQYIEENGIENVLILYNIQTIRDDIGILRIE